MEFKLVRGTSLLLSAAAFGILSLAKADGALPSSCTPSIPLPHGYACVYGYQCESLFCHPRYKVCLKSKKASLGYSDLMAKTDTLVRQLIFGYDSRGTCGNPVEPACVQDSTGQPTSDWDQSACECKEQYMTRYLANSWVSLNNVSGLPGLTWTCPDGVPQPGDEASLAKAMASTTTTTTTKQKCLIKGGCDLHRRRRYRGAYVPRLENRSRYVGADGWVKAHNVRRCMHGVGPVKWSEDVAASAQEWVNQLGQTMRHSEPYDIPPPAGPAGENLAAGGRHLVLAVDSWYSEVSGCIWDERAPCMSGKICEDHPNCEPGSEPSAAVVGHFTAMIWKGTTHIGCADNGDDLVWICRYYSGPLKSSDPEYHKVANVRSGYPMNVFPAIKTKEECEAEIWSEATTPMGKTTTPTIDTTAEKEVPPAQEESFISVDMTLNVDYQKLSAGDKDELKGKLRDTFAKSASVDQSAVSVELTQGSVKVYAEIRMPDADSAQSAISSISGSNLEQEVVEVGNSIPGVKAAAQGELKVEGFEVKAGTTTQVPDTASETVRGSDVASAARVSLQMEKLVWALAAISLSLSF